MTSDLFINAIGVAAGLCSMASFVPQLIKIWREHDASGVSLRMYAITALGFALWISFGLFRGAWPVVGSNAVCLVLVLIIVGLRIRFGDGAATPAHV